MIDPHTLRTTANTRLRSARPNCLRSAATATSGIRGTLYKISSEALNTERFNKLDVFTAVFHGALLLNS